MIPGMNVDPRKMQALMKQMGIQNNELNSSKVTIDLIDGNTIVIENPSVTEIVMQGNKSYQIAGDVKIIENKILEEDIDLVSTSANISKEKAKELLEETNGDIAKAISLVEK